MTEERSGLSSAVHACPLLSQAERLKAQSLPLRHWALTCTHICHPLLHKFSYAWCSVNRGDPLGIVPRPISGWF